jgi:putative tryptophan/tyrosine transport system substrate-binding protein
VTELVQRKIDVIVMQGTSAVLAAKQATSVIPIVFAIAGNPVTNGLVASLALPGSNVTGLTNQTAELAGKKDARSSRRSPAQRQRLGPC